MKISVKSPTRVDFAGGTIDCWPIYTFLGECYTINLSIDILTAVTLSTREDQMIDFQSSDQEYSRIFQDLDELMSCREKPVQLLKVCVDYWKPHKGFTITTSSQSPVGGGLGGSSSLLVSMLKAFGRMFRKDWELGELVNVAHNIEAKLLHTPTGTQDYYPAASPGMCVLKYNHEGCKIEKLKYDPKEIESRMILVYTGRSHNSGINNWQVIKAAVEKELAVTESLKDIAVISQEMVSAFRESDWESIGKLFSRDYKARMNLTSEFNSPEIEKLESITKIAGADGFNICGAGGGGCVLIWCQPDKKASIVESIERENFKVLQAKPIGQ